MCLNFGFVIGCLNLRVNRAFLFSEIGHDILSDWRALSLPWNGSGTQIGFRVPGISRKMGFKIKLLHQIRQKFGKKKKKYNQNPKPGFQVPDPSLVLMLWYNVVSLAISTYENFFLLLPLQFFSSTPLLHIWMFKYSNC